MNSRNGRLKGALRYLRRAHELVLDVSYDEGPRDGAHELARSLDEALRDLSELLGERL